jgi:hypothetical protein
VEINCELRLQYKYSTWGDLGFHRDGAENCALLGCYAASSDILYY